MNRFRRTEDTMLCAGDRTRRACRGLVGVIALSLVTGIGCTFDEGQAWGRVAIDLQAGMVFEPARIVAPGWLKTARNYAIELQSLALGFESVALTIAGEAASTFDPARPPPGYSLCHNGHCHADDGRLVDYDEIARELATSSPGGLTFVQPALDPLVSLTPSMRSITLLDCAEIDDCSLPKGQTRSVSLRFRELAVTAIVRDLLPGEQSRLPPQGVPVQLRGPLDVDVGAQLIESFDRRRPIGLALQLEYRFPPGAFDAIDWAEFLDPAAEPPEFYPASAEAWMTAIADHLGSASDALLVHTERFDP